MSASIGRGSFLRAADRHPAQWLALIVGAVFLIVGVVGFAVTGVRGFVAPEGELLFGVFQLNPLHNIVHLAIGAAGLAMANRLDRARVFGWLLAVVYGAAFVYGLFVAGSATQANFLALNAADNWLHIVSALAGVAIAVWPATRGVRPRAHPAH